MGTWSIASRDFAGLAAHLLQSGHAIQFRAHGASMLPFIRDGDTLTVRPAAIDPLRAGDVVLYRHPDGRVVAHRILGRKAHQGVTAFRIRGDALCGSGDLIPADRILGHVVRIQRGGKAFSLEPWHRQTRALLWARMQPASGRLYRGAWRIKMMLLPRRKSPPAAARQGLP